MQQTADSAAFLNNPLNVSHRRGFDAVSPRHAASTPLPPASDVAATALTDEPLAVCIVPDTSIDSDPAPPQADASVTVR